MAARAPVFATFERLEAILLELSPFELGTAALVDEAWKETIQNSSRLADIKVLTPINHAEDLGCREGSIVYAAKTEPALHPAFPSPLRMGNPSGDHQGFHADQ